MGQGLPYPAPAVAPWANLFNWPSWTGDDTARLVAQDWYFGGLGPPEPVEIPWTWITGEVRFRQDRAATYAAVTREGGSTAIEVVDSDEQTDFTATLSNLNQQDHANLAHFATVYYDEPRHRLSQVTFMLNSRLPDEIWTLLSVGVGRRFTITDAPATWPEGATSLVVEGIAHSSSADARYITWSTSPVIGETAGEVGPFFRIGVSQFDGDDLLAW